MSRPLIIAHRAMTPQAAENAISSLAGLEEAGADLVELDIRLSLDRQPFVTHDAFLKRTTRARGWVRLWPSPLLRRVPLRGGEPGERIAPLHQMLQAFPAGLQPALHLKDRDAINGVLRTIERHGDPSRTWLWLEYPADVRRARARIPELRCTLLRPSGWMPEHRSAYMRDARDCGAHAVSLPWGVITPDLILLARQHKLLVFSRFQETPSIAANVGRGIDGIITDDPALIAKSLETTT
jgi:glycerophosphoryl diester phosphodiesterase